MNRLGHVLKGLGALVVLVVVVAGIPWALWHFIGWPLPHHVPTAAQVGHALNHQGIPAQTLIDALAVVVWFTWAVLVASLAVELPAALSGRRPPRLPIAGIFQPVTGRLVAAVIVACLALAPRPGHTAPAHPGADLPGTTTGRPVAALILDRATLAATVQPVTTSAPLAASGPVVGQPPSPSAGATDATTVYVVQRGDTLWGIAQRQLGDPLRWSEIFALNEGRPQPGGVTLTDPHWIDPGWTLLLPATATPQPATPPPATAPATTTTTPSPAPPATTEPAPSTPATIPPTATTPTTTAPSTAPSTSSSAHPETTVPVHASPDTAPVQLPSGSVVAGSFAAGVLSAVALGRLRRRHAYRYRPPRPSPAPATEPLRPTLRHLATAAAANGHRPPGPDEAPAMADDDPDHRERPDLIDLGEHDGAPVPVALSDLTGVTLTGPDTDDVVRAWLAALIVRAGPIAAEALVTDAALDWLVPGLAAIPPGMRVMDDPGRALRALETQVLARTRQLDADDTPDIVAWRQANPCDPVPTIVAVLDTIPADQTARWQAVIEAGGRLGLGVVVLDPDTPTPVRLDLGSDHTVTAAAPDRLAHLAGTRLFALQPGEAADLLAALADAEQRPDSTTEPELADHDNNEPEPEAEAPDADHDGPAHDEPDPLPPPITVRLLGPYEIDVNGQPITTGLRTPAKELLAWYLLRPEGATIETAVDELWPDTEPARVHKQFWIAASNLRTRLGGAADPETKLLVQTGDSYRLDPDAIGSDLWQFQAALAHAVRASDDTAARDLLRRAVACYRGDLAQGADYHWIEPVRHDLHRRALDAHLRLAELEDRLGNPEAAIATLERAVELDRYAEEPYRRLMALHARRDRPDAIAATWRLLQRHLAEIDVDPEPATERLHHTLTTTPGSPSRSQRARLPS